MSWIGNIADMLWGNSLAYLILLWSLLFSIATRFVQVRHFKNMLRSIIRGRSSKEGISPFQAFTLALSGRVGQETSLALPPRSHSAVQVPSFGCGSWLSLGLRQYLSSRH